MRIALVGEGAIGRAHLSSLSRIEGVDVALLVGLDPLDTAEVARNHGVETISTDFDEMLARDDIEAVVLCTPSPLHARQATAVLEAGKHCLIEIPMADNLADARALVATAERSGRVAMVCHTRRFNPSHQWLHQRLDSGALKLQHLVVETFFLRRTNTNALGETRMWTDHLLWHHACHSVDLFHYQTGDDVDQAFALQGPVHRDLGISMDMSIGLRGKSGALLTLALSFNNDGPLGTTFRYICDDATYIARYDRLATGEEAPVDVSEITATDGARVEDGTEMQDREFFAAIREGRDPNASVAECLPAMVTLDRLELLLRRSSTTLLR